MLVPRMAALEIADWRDDYLPAAPGSTVFVLGAGFSRAVNVLMPLTDALGDLCGPLVGAGLHTSATKYAGGYFESYLSVLAADQPYLSAMENLQNRALFEGYSSAIADVLGSRQEEILENPPPEWLVEFLLSAHHLKAGVVTFNYDTLLECLVNSPLGPLDDPKGDWGSFDPFFWDELTGGVPAWPPGPARFGATRRDTLRLLKLHGSLNWYWSAGDTSGATVAKRDLPGSWMSPRPYTEDDRQRELPGRVPFLVPPTATKSPYYSSPQLRESWQQARARLAAARYVFLLGYSLPATDTTTGTMFRAALAESESTIVVADLNAGPVVDRLVQLGIAETRIRTMRARESGPVPSLCHELATRLSSFTLSRLSTVPPDEPLVVSWGNHCHALVIDVTTTADEVILAMDPPVGDLASLNIGKGAEPGRESTPLRVSDLPLAMAPSIPLTAQLVSGQRQPIIDHSSVTFMSGQGPWRVLRSSGSSPIHKAE
jgi:hypothetical protein